MPPKATESGSRSVVATPDARAAPPRGARVFLGIGVSILANTMARCYLQIMELLEQLESQIEALLARLDRLKAENARMSAEYASVETEKATLEEENHKLREALEREETLRTEALGRVDSLLRKIQEHDSVE